MAKPPAEFTLHKLYKGKVEIKEFKKSHTYKVWDEKNARNWEKSPSATGITGTVDKGDGLKMYAMSESMKYMDRQFQNISVKKAIDDENFTFKKLFKDARAAHITKTHLGQSVGTATHTYFEELLRALATAQKKRGQIVVPPIPRATELSSDLTQSFQNIVSVYKFNSIENAEKFRATISKDVEVRSLIWQEALMTQRACEAVEGFLVGAMKERALRVWAIEQIVHSRKFFYSGRFDAILEFLKPFVWRGYTIPAGVYITDLKTSNPGTDYPMGLYPNHLDQCGLYDVAFCEEFPEYKDRITGHLLLGSSKHGDGFHPYVARSRARNCQSGMALVPVKDFVHLGEKELKGVNYYGGDK